jgi:hypothetical protein
VAVHLCLGYDDDRDDRLDVLPTDRHCEPWLHVCPTWLDGCKFLTLHRSIAKSQLLNIPTSVLSITIIAISGYVCLRLRLPLPNCQSNTFAVRRLSLAAAPNFTLELLGYHPLLLQRLVHFPIKWRCVCGHRHRQFILTILVPNDVAMASPDYI